MGRQRVAASGCADITTLDAGAGQVQPRSVQASSICQAVNERRTNVRVNVGLDLGSENYQNRSPNPRDTRSATIMSPSVDDAQAQWLEQLAAMRKAIAELNLPAEGQKPPAYGDDIEFDDDDFSGTASGEDIWDIISDEYDDEYSSDHLEQFSDLSTGASSYSQQWLTEKCAGVAQRSSGLDAGALKEQISAILASDSNGMVFPKPRSDNEQANTV
jgi:hypothetical protein